VPRKGWSLLEFKILIIVAAALLLIAPDKVPDLARALGKMVRMFNRAKEEMERTVQAGMLTAEETAKPFSDTGKTLASSLYQDTVEDDEEEEEE
jgi:Sec-independent protein translocase protein TatA